MDAQKFVKENNLQNIELEINGKRESILSILERFQEPIIEKSDEMKNKIFATNRVMSTQPMSPMTEMDFKRVIAECRSTLKTLNEL